MIRCYSEIMCKKSKKSPDASFQAPETTRLIAEAADFLQKCKSRAKSIKVSRPTRSPPSTEAGSATYSREMADVLAKLYFTSFESAHRILHAPTFWAEYEKYWERPESASPDLRHKVNLVIGIGSSLYDYGDAAASQRRTELLHQWIYSAQTWLSGPLEKDRLDISGLQVYCLTILARQIFSIGGDTVWMSMGSLVHRAMQVGLHLDPKHLPAMPALQAELRRRLWATILEFVVQSSLDAWMPPRIALSEFDTEPPSNINDEDMDESTTAVQPRPRDTFTSTSLQLALLESLPTRLRIVELLNGMHSELRYERVLSLTSELTSALQNQATLFQSPGNGSTPFHRNYLDYLTRRFIIPLHYPFSHQARVNPLFHRSVKLSLDAGLALVSPEPDDGMFTRLTTISGGMFREGFRSATTAISLELLTHVATQRSDGSLHRVPQYRGFLKQAVRDLIGVSEQRIRMGETNVKSHMFLSMILAEVEAVEDGKPVEVEVARAARDSLQFCEGLLAARTDINSDMASASPSGDDGTGIGAWGMGGGQGGFEFEGLAVDFDWEIFATN
ncbi:205fc1b6-2513-496d-9409-9095ae86af20 [Thermothielavioides terrestris]|uniref:205fc1b6-2513-496d-9409-9095ae86af20 n=1 Tax=Thermothielavioides terrestris TaxID=2587410 RepID=A0A3S4B1T6_9PEZI|nr:205fc1b6-2513-496d-9409-9095ae86af20 [Thermothielavioides terrestris]